MSLADLPHETTDRLHEFRRAGVLSAADVHTAAVLARLGQDVRPDVVLAAALAARAPRLGHVCVDLSTVAMSAVAETGGPESGSAAADLPDVAQLDWPADPDAWIAAVASSPLVTDPSAPLVVDRSLVYLDRYRRYEDRVIEHLQARAHMEVSAPADATADRVIDTLLDGEGSDAQRAAVRAARSRGLSVLVGGPGTGKTRTVAALLASLLSDGRTLDIALAAPTGKAAARMTEAFDDAVAGLSEDMRSRMSPSPAVTLHRLLGATRNSSRFRHDSADPLPHDIVIVDETSMVSLPLMAHLLDAVRPDAQVVLVGDPGQLASVEAGSVLGDVAGPVMYRESAPAGPLAGVVFALTHSRRFPPGSPLDRFATAVRLGDVPAALAVLTDEESPKAAQGALVWRDHEADTPQGRRIVRRIAEPAATSVMAKAEAGDAVGALRDLESVRVLCAHRRGPFGVERWNANVERWLAGTGARTAAWYVGRPVLVTANDYTNGLFNGDIGVVVRDGDRAMVAFPGADAPRLVAPSRLADVDTVHAMTIHKSQGSEFDHVVVLLPSGASRLASRELLYTAVTRAQRLVTIVGDEKSITAAIERRVVRASGISARLWV